MLYGVYGAVSIYAGILIDVAGIANTRAILCIQAAITAVFLISYYYFNAHKDKVISPKEEQPAETPDTAAQ